MTWFVLLYFNMLLTDRPSHPDLNLIPSLLLMVNWGCINLYIPTRVDDTLFYNSTRGRSKDNISLIVDQHCIDVLHIYHCGPYPVFILAVEVYVSLGFSPPCIVFYFRIRLMCILENWTINQLLLIHAWGGRGHEEQLPIPALLFPDTASPSAIISSDLFYTSSSKCFITDCLLKIIMNL